MAAFNVVRFRVKPGRDQDFIEAHRAMSREIPKGARRFVLIKTGDRTFCALGEWDSFDHIVAARPTMIGYLGGMREMLEDLGGELGVTDPVSGESVVEMSAASRKAAPRRRKAAGKKRATSVKRASATGRRKSAAKTGGKRAARKPAKRPARKAAAKRARR
jgi:hypothetical protein